MATCKDCLHVEACEFISQRQEKFMNDFFNEQGREISVKFGLPDAEKCPYFKERSRFVELPCKVGDILYALEPHIKGRYKKYFVKKGTVYSIYISKINGMRWELEFPSQKTGSYFRTYNSSNIGKTVFLIKEQAERALKERESE